MNFFFQQKEFLSLKGKYEIPNILVLGFLFVFCWAAMSLTLIFLKFSLTTYLNLLKMQEKLT